MSYNKIKVKIRNKVEEGVYNAEITFYEVVADEFGRVSEIKNSVIYATICGDWEGAKNWEGFLNKVEEKNEGN